MKPVYVGLLSQIAILAAYSIALPKLPDSRWHVFAFGTCFALSVALLTMGWLDWEDVAGLRSLAEVVILVSVPSSTMLLGSLATWRTTQKVFNSTLVQVSLAVVIGFVALLLGTALGVILSIWVAPGSFHI